jgi:polysaccharide biosynthesis transport protein
VNSRFIPDFQIRNGGTASGDWSIADCWKALYRHKWMLAAITGAGLLIASLVSLVQPRWYRSQASLEVQGINENFLDLREIYQNASPGPDIDGTYLQTQAEIVEEDAVLEQVIQKLNLPDTVEALRRNISVNFNRGSRILRISAEARSPKLAADIANATAAALIERNVANRQQAARQTYEALKAQLADLRERRRYSDEEPDSANRRFYEATVERADAAKLASSLPQSNIKIISTATPANRPFKPNKPLNFAIGLFAGLLLGAGWVLLREQTDSALHAPGDASACLPVPELGAIPEAGGTGSRLVRFRGGDPNLPVERAALEQQFSRVSEAFRATLASILSAGSSAGPSRVLVVTSSQPMEGKTTVVSNLGIALAGIHNRVLLIDGDMRRPRLHKVFDQPNSWGLSDLLREKNAIEEVPVDALVKKTAIPHLYLLPSGTSTENVFSLLYSGRLERLLPRFREEFDYVLVDAPPCLEFADARIMARYAEQLLLVVRADYTGRQTAQTAARRLLLDGISVMGVILNRWDPAYSREYAYASQSGLEPQEAR